MNLVFTGFMGSGKTAAGKIVAKKLGRSFYDTDEMIEKDSGFSIREIFEKSGEDIFRQIESKIIKKVSEFDNAVISCGGGVVLNPENIENLRKNGIVINLYASPEEIFERVKRNTCRPLLQCKNPLEKIKKLLEERKSAYANNDIAFNTDGLTLEQVANIIINNDVLNKKIKEGKK